MAGGCLWGVSICMKSRLWRLQFLLAEIIPHNRPDWFWSRTLWGDVTRDDLQRQFLWWQCCNNQKQCRNNAVPGREMMQYKATMVRLKTEMTQFRRTWTTRFKAKRQSHSWINHTAENQSDCKNRQWFQNGYNQSINHSISQSVNQSISQSINQSRQST